MADFTDEDRALLRITSATLLSMQAQLNAIEDWSEDANDTLERLEKSMYLGNHERPVLARLAALESKGTRDTLSIGAVATLIASTVAALVSALTGRLAGAP